MPNSPLRTILTLPRVKSLALPKSFTRGREYLASGAVESITEFEETLNGVVNGTEKYAVRLAVKQETLDYHCSCPFSSGEGEFCKHCVAVALAWLDSADPAKAKPAGKTSKMGNVVVRLEDIRPWLLSQENEILVNWLLEAAAANSRLRDRLLRRTAIANSKEIDLAVYRESIRQATTVRGYIEWDEVADFAGKLHDIVDSIEELAGDGFTDEARELTEYALSRLLKVVENIHDEGDLNYPLEKLISIHLEACRKTKPAVTALAELLFTWEMEDPVGYVSGISQQYAELLGTKGIAHLKTLAEKHLEDTDESSHAAMAILQSMAQAANDIEALVALKTRDLSNSHSYLAIAEIYHEDGKYDKALDWAENGLKKFPGINDTRLIDFLCKEYQRRKSWEKAAGTAWEFFQRYPGLENFQRLKKNVKNSAEPWESWRNRALNVLRATFDKKIGKHSSHKTFFPTAWRSDYSELVRVFLWENDLDSAWNAAMDNGCDGELWLLLADKRASKHPEDSIQIYLKNAALLIEQTNNQSYQKAIRVLKKTRLLYEKLGQSPKWDLVLKNLREKYCKKRNFIELSKIAFKM
ncbi:MAG: SWIM zinc finger family protein [Puniceicoccales bacterium]|jgi:uncharacterized Zn finger protein|nr:SWIM zinc finger family protein [Puniceicoccales bacterium]